MSNVDTSTTTAFTYAVLDARSSDDMLTKRALFDANARQHAEWIMVNGKAVGLTAFAKAHKAALAKLPKAPEYDTVNGIRTLVTPSQAQAVASKAYLTGPANVGYLAKAGAVMLKGGKGELPTVLVKGERVPLSAREVMTALAKLDAPTTDRILRETTTTNAAWSKITSEVAKLDAARAGSNGAPTTTGQQSAGGTNVTGSSAGKAGAGKAGAGAGKAPASEPVSPLDMLKATASYLTARRGLKLKGDEIAQAEIVMRALIAAGCPVPALTVPPAPRKAGAKAGATA